MRTRTKDWLDLKTMKPAYGFQVFHDGQWKDVAEDGKACIFASPAKRDKKRSEFRKLRLK